MNIQPLNSIHVTLTTEGSSIQSQLLHLSDEILEISSALYLHAPHNKITFESPFFHGQGIVKNITYVHDQFQYVIEIYTIHFEPGFLVNAWS